MYLQKLSRFRVGRRTLPGRFAGAAGGRVDGSSAGAGVGFVLGRPVLINQGAAGGPQGRVLCRSAGKSLKNRVKSEYSWDDILGVILAPVCMYVCMYLRRYVSMYVRMYIHTYIHAYIHTPTHIHT